MRAPLPLRPFFFCTRQFCFSLCLLIVLHPLSLSLSLLIARICKWPRHSPHPDSVSSLSDPSLLSSHTSLPVCPIFSLYLRFCLPILFFFQSITLRLLLLPSCGSFPFFSSILNLVHFSFSRGLGADVSCGHTAMNTKTMRLPPRRVLTPSAAPNNNKRKDRDEGFERPKPNPSPSSNIPTTLNPTKFLKPDKPRALLEPPRSSDKGLEPTSSNHLLAGFLAHEFLTKGTLFGEPWDPSGAAEGPTPSEADKRKGKGSQSQTREAEPEKQERYAELAELLRASGTHVAGIVNPTQLSRFLHL